MIFKKIKSRISDSGISYIVVGLGNPGKKYENTRHNAGFLAIDTFAKDNNTTISRLKFHALTETIMINGEKVLLMKPQTYMNLSGQAVAEAMNFYKMPPEKVLLLHDDIYLDLGIIRIKRKGSHGGQNGVKDIIAKAGSENFPRIKIGIGNKPHPDYDLADWVTSAMSKKDMALFMESAENASKAISLIVSGKIDDAMSKYSH